MYPHLSDFCQILLLKICRTRDRSIPCSLNRWFSTKSSIWQLSFFFFISQYTRYAPGTGYVYHIYFLNLGHPRLGFVAETGICYYLRLSTSFLFFYCLASFFAYFPRPHSVMFILFSLVGAACLFYCIVSFFSYFPSPSFCYVSPILSCWCCFVFFFSCHLFIHLVFADLTLLVGVFVVLSYPLR